MNSLNLKFKNLNTLTLFSPSFSNLLVYNSFRFNEKLVYSDMLKIFSSSLILKWVR